MISFILLRGRCANCRSRISIRYPLVEILTAFTFGLAYRIYGPSLYTAFVILFLTLLIALALIDLEHMILPDPLTLGGGVVFPDLFVLSAADLAPGRHPFRMSYPAFCLPASISSI